MPEWHGASGEAHGWEAKGESECVSTWCSGAGGHGEVSGEVWEAAVRGHGKQQQGSTQVHSAIGGTQGAAAEA